MNGWPNPTIDLPQASWFRAEDKAAAKAAAELKFRGALASDRSGEALAAGVGERVQKRNALMASCADRPGQKPNEQDGNSCS